MDKLEEEIKRRDREEDATMKAFAKSQEAKEKKRERQDRLSERKEFNRLFKRLRGMVEGRWDRYGNGWRFKYKGGDFYIAYEDWFSPKTPGDADDYDMRGSNWVLKLGFNGIQGRTITLDHESHPKDDLTDEVMEGLRELAKKFASTGGRFYDDESEED